MTYKVIDIEGVGDICAAEQKTADMKCERCAMG